MKNKSLLLLGLAPLISCGEQQTQDSLSSDVQQQKAVINNEFIIKEAKLPAILESTVNKLSKGKIIRGFVTNNYLTFGASIMVSNNCSKVYTRFYDTNENKWTHSRDYGLKFWSLGLDASVHIEKYIFFPFTEDIIGGFNKILTSKNIQFVVAKKAGGQIVVGTRGIMVAGRVGVGAGVAYSKIQVAKYNELCR